MRQTVDLGLGLLLFALAGCDSGDEETVRVKECRNVCERRDMCLRDTDVADCDQRCSQQEFRSDLYYQLKAKCVTDGSLACDEWATELDNRGEDVCLGADCNLDACVHRELASHKLTPDQEEYCGDLSNLLFACDRSLDPNALTVTCQKTLLEVSQQYADDTEECAQLRCVTGNEFRECFADLALRYETDIKIFGL
ncbi:MAG: hypothetical protein QM778_13430 [Myxococcales bacterium]